MSEYESRLLPEGLSPTELVDDLEFTEVTDDGEVYTLYRIVRITEEFIDSRDNWSHLANVVRVRDPGIGVAHLLIRDRVIYEAMVTLYREDA